MISKATIVGRIGKKEHKETKNGGLICALSIVTKKRYIDSQGEKQEQESWHNVNFYNRIADCVIKYDNVGDLVYIEGEISNKKVETEHGVVKWIYSITGYEIRKLSPPKLGDKDEPNGNLAEDVSMWE